MRLPTSNDNSGRDFGSEELELLARVIAAGALEGARGTQVRQLEREFAARHEMPFCRAVHTAAGALVLALAALDLEPGDEVIVPRDAADVEAAVLLAGGAVKLAGIDPATRNLDAESVAQATGPQTRAVVVRHMFGRPADLDAIRAAARGALLIEDCSQAPLARYRGGVVGTFGEIAVFSLRQECHVTAGEGGLALTANRDRAHLMGVILQGEEIPGVQPMTELAAAVARAQLRKLEGCILRRQRAAGVLTELLIDLPALTAPIAEPESSHVYWKYPIWVNAEAIEGGAMAMATELRREGIGCFPAGDLLLVDWNEFYSQQHIEFLAAQIRAASERLNRLALA